MIFYAFFEIIRVQMFEFLGRKKIKKAMPIIRTRPEHCISRKNIDQDALRVLYRLDKLGYTAYLVGGGVRDLLLGRKPKDFDVGTSALPNEVKHAFRNCFLIGRRFRLAHVRFGQKIIETATFRQTPQTVGDAIEQASGDGHSPLPGEPVEDNTYGTPETDAHRRDFTVNGLFYNIHDFSVIDWVGGLEDLDKKLIRSIGDPMVRFREDPVRMMRAIKFASRLDFAIEKNTSKAIHKLHGLILNAAPPRVCEEVFRLFPYGKSEAAFRMMWEYGLMGDLMPELAEFIAKDGGEKSGIWKYLATLDRYERAMMKQEYEVPNGLRAAVLYAAWAHSNPGHGREIMGTMLKSLKIPKATYFAAVLMIDSVKRLSRPPDKNRRRLLRNRDFPDALDFNRIVLRAEGKSETVLNQWENLYNEEMSKEK